MKSRKKNIWKDGYDEVKPTDISKSKKIIIEHDKEQHHNEKAPTSMEK